MQGTDARDRREGQMRGTCIEGYHRSKCARDIHVQSICIPSIPNSDQSSQFNTDGSPSTSSCLRIL
jgi:hypothetical protein